MTEMRVDMVGPGARLAIKWGKIAQAVGESLADYVTAGQLTTELEDKASTSLTISAGTGLTGGGDLTTNRSFALSAGVLASLELADSALQPDALSGYVTTAALTEAVDEASAAVTAVAIDDQPRPGDAPGHFTATLTGAPSAGAAAPGTSVAVSEDGTIRRLTGTNVITTRPANGLLVGHTYKARAVVRRTTDPTDPAGDTVRIGVQWLNSNKAQISQRVIADVTLTVAMGLQTLEMDFAYGTEDFIPWPATARYARPFIETYGPNGVTSVVVLEWKDVTDAGASVTPPLNNYQLWLADGNEGTLEDYLAFGENGLQDIADAVGIDAGRAEAAADALSATISATGKNLADPALIKPGKQYSPGGSTIISAPEYRSLGFIELMDGETYTIGGIEPSMSAYVGPDAVEAGAMTSVGAMPSGVGAKITFTASAPNLFLWVHLTNNGSAVTTYDGTVQIEKGSSATEYEVFRRLIGLESIESDTIPRMEFQTGKNLFDPASAIFNKRYTTATKNIVTDITLPIGLAPWFEIERGQYYTLSGDGVWLSSGLPWAGLFTSWGATVAPDNVSFSTAISGVGHQFLAPEGDGPLFLAFNIDTNAEKTEIVGKIQLEVGQHATEFEDYVGRLSVLPENLPPGFGEGAADVVLPRVERAFPSRATIPASDWLGLEVYGQSNAVGAGQSTVVTSTALYSGRVLTFSGGPKADPDSAGSTMTATKSLVEDGTSGDGAGAVRGETIVSGMSYGLLERLYQRTGQALADLPVVFGHTAGKGGQSISPLSTTYYPRFTTSIVQLKARAVAAGKSVIVGAIPYDGNEANQGTTAQATWQTALRTLYNTMVTDVKAATGQSFDPVMLLPQKSWGAQPTALTPAGSTNTYPASVTLGAVAEQGNGVFVAFPDYATFFAGSDGIHRTAVGHKLAGHYFARAAERILYRGEEWRGLSAKSAWVQGNSCYVRFDVPVQPILLDTQTLGAATQSGFKLVDASGDLPISLIEVAGGDLVRLSLGRTRNGAVTLRIGLDYLPAASGLAAGSAGTCLRDSDTEIVKIGGMDYMLANWCLASTLTPLIMEA